MKIIDKYIAKSFLIPYIISFLIAEFVLVMQFLWLNIDDMAGKGLSIIDILELIFYYAVVMIPMAVPITILISSVMVFGNISEKYELSSMKSAGISLFRVMRFGIIIAITTFLFSLLASNYLKPKAAYNYSSKLLSIRKKKPTIALDEKVFNKDFNGYTIRIGKKSKNKKDIEDIKMYNHSKIGNQNFNIISARKGSMFSTEDENFFVIQLEDGFQYQEQKKSDQASKTYDYPFIRTEFRQWEKVFDLSEFSMKEANSRLFQKKRDLMNSVQLMAQIDTSTKRINRQLNRIDPLLVDYVEQAEKASQKNATSPRSKLRAKRKIIQQYDVSDLSKYENFRSTLDSTKMANLASVASGYVETVKNRVTSVSASIESFSKTRYYYILGLHQQFSWAFICVVFLFIGSSMGSIIRKGGYGFPVLFAILFFMSFIILSITGDKLSRSMTLDPITAAWLPVIVLSPLALFLTIKAMNDSKVMNFDTAFKFIKKLYSNEADS
jgi:lipopolysaccharide export system permease protein